MAKAIVCDCCGKTELIEDKYPFDMMNTYTLRGPRDELCLDLCEECVTNLVKATRKEETL